MEGCGQVYISAALSVAIQNTAAAVWINRRVWTSVHLSSPVTKSMHHQENIQHIKDSLEHVCRLCMKLLPQIWTRPGLHQPIR